jgi:hypothetical protein
MMFFIKAFFIAVLIWGPIIFFLLRKSGAVKVYLISTDREPGHSNAKESSQWVKDEWKRLKDGEFLDNTIKKG